MKRLPQISLQCALLAGLSGAGAIDAAAAEASRSALKVCAPPFNLPMSDKDESGYENRIAKLFANQLELPLEYTWFPQRMGFIRATLKNNETEDGSYKCDLVMGVVDNFELAATTRPYMHSTWAMVYAKGRGLDFIQSQADMHKLTDAQKKLLRIGVWDQGPTTEWVYRLGLIEQATPYPIMSGDARQGPGHVIENDLVQDKVNLTFVWGPIAGFLAKRIPDPELVVIPLENEQGLKFDYQISMAVRHPDTAWKRQVNALIERNQAEIDSILDEFGVPRLPLILTNDEREDDDD
ncbi:MAG: quinoprotein dehydrogenase-associated putative ABC transporter substrate-binding protein [Gammaproteobacteria bacterium]